MIDDEENFQVLFRERLNWLFEHIRKSNGKLNTTSDIARKADLAIQLVADYRRGIRDNPTLTSIVALAKAFNVPIAYFFSEQDHQTQEHELLKHDRKDLLELTLRASELTPEVVQQIVEIINIFHQPKKDHSLHDAEGDSRDGEKG